MTGPTLDDVAAQGPAPDDLRRISLQIGIFAARAAQIKDDYDAVRRAAEEKFAEARRRGITQVELILPDGTKAGLLSIKRGADVWTVDEDMLTVVAAGNDARDFEDVVDPKALRDDRVKALLAEHCPDLVTSQLTAEARARYKRQWEDTGGYVIDGTIGERVKVATVEHLPASGEFSYRPVDRARHLLQDAIAAGQINEYGEYLTGDPQAAEPLPEPPAAQEAVPVTMPCGTDDSEEARWARIRAAMGTEGDPDQPPPRDEPAKPAKPAKPAGAGKGGHPPTGEQQRILDAFGTGENVVIEAGAGAGKTSTLKMMARSAGRRRGRYLAFNKSIVSDATASGEFPRSVKISTAHALAMGAVGHRYGHRLNGERQYASARAKILGINAPVVIGDLKLSPSQLARLVSECVEKFCKSAAPDIGVEHLPEVNGLTSPAALDAMRREVLPLARKAWDDLVSLDGKLRFDHDHYLKIWQLDNPRLPESYILYDEAQDAARVVLDVVIKQDGQLCAVGDSAQAINGWAGAVNSLASFPAKHRLALSQSFRFGPAIATEANKWLALLRSDLRLTGFDRITSAVRTVDVPDAVLFRTNASAVGEVIRLVEAGHKTALVGGAQAMRDLAEACLSLKAGQGCTHPELWPFRTWAEVVDFAENDPTGSDLAVLVRLIADHGAEKIIQIADALADEADAEVTVSTAHKAKGREWDSVRIGNDFHPPADDEDDGVSPDLCRLAYVAVTRARLSLDREGLAWVDEYLPGRAS